jgi:hypothetical protein
MPIIQEAYFAPHRGAGVGRNIISNLLPGLNGTPVVRSGVVFTIDIHQIGYDPLPGVRKDLILIMADGRELRFPESEQPHRQIVISIP